MEEKKLEATINIPVELHKQISNRYGKDSLSDFATAAMQELIDWMNAEKRPTSLSEIESNRIFTIYSSILKDLLPTADEIGQSFNLPMGRSRYIVQSLNYQHPDFMRFRRIRAIIVAFEKEEASKAKLPAAIIPKECVEYLTAIMTELQLEGKVVSMPSYKVLSEDVRVEIGVSDKAPLLKRLKDEENRLKPK